MIDIVLNHVGYVPYGSDFKDIVPFNDKKYYHDWCEITSTDFNSNNE